MPDLDSLEDLEEQIIYLTHLTKSADPMMAEHARDALDRLATADLEKVGPKGYIHGWVFVGNRGTGTRIEHPEHGHGTVTRSGSRTVGVRFDNGKEHAFEHGESHSGGHFTARSGSRSAPAPKPAKATAAPKPKPEPKPRPVKAAPKPKPIKAAPKPKPEPKPTKAAPKPKPPKKKPVKAAPKPEPKKPTGALHADFAHRSVGKNLVGDDPQALVRRVMAGRDKQHAADHMLAVIGHEQGFDKKPRVVSKAEMDKLVQDGHTETFRGVKNVFEGPTGAEVHEQMRSGHTYYGHGIYGNGYYWGDHKTARDYSDTRPGSVARAVISPDAKIADFYGPGGKDLGGFDEEHTKFLAATDDPKTLETYGDIGRYAAALGYDVIRINQKNGPPFYNVLNRSALVVEEAQ